MNDLKIAVCLLDDDDTTTMIYNKLLSSFGFDLVITEHNNYQNFIDKISLNPIEFDLILMDIEMNDSIDFIEKIKEIKSIAEYAYMVVLTASLDPINFMNASAHGVGYVVKSMRETNDFLKLHLKTIYNKIKKRNEHLKNFI